MLQCSSATAPILLQQLQQPVIVAFVPQLMEFIYHDGAVSVFTIYKVSRKKAGNTQQKHVFELRTEGQNTVEKAVEGKYSKQSVMMARK